MYAMTCNGTRPPMFGIWGGGSGGGGGTAVDTTVDASGFTQNLGATDTNVQHALETIDQLSTGGTVDYSPIWLNA